MTHTETFLRETQEIAKTLDSAQVERLVKELKYLRDRGGRLFLVGLGGSAANCSHAVNDFRRLCNIDASTPVDNSAELTARINDDGWVNALSCPLKAGDVLFILSVGGGGPQVSRPIGNVIGEALAADCQILGIVGRDGGDTAMFGHEIVIIPTVNPDRVTPHTEAFQMVILHAIVSHPDLQIRKTKW